MSRPVAHPERNAEIVRLRKAGEWPRAIARSMGLSHNAVIGVCNRAGLSSAAGNAEVPRGADNHRAKLTDEAVRQIRREYVPSDSERGGSALARRFGVSQGTVSMIVLRKTWKHVA